MQGFLDMHNLVTNITPGSHGENSHVRGNSRPIQSVPPRKDIDRPTVDGESKTPRSHPAGRTDKTPVVEVGACGVSEVPPRINKRMQEESVAETQSVDLLHIIMNYKASPMPPHGEDLPVWCRLTVVHVAILHVSRA